MTIHDIKIGDTAQAAVKQPRGGPEEVRSRRKRNKSRKTKAYHPNGDMPWLFL